MQRTFDNFTDWSPTANGATEEALNRQLETFIEVLQTLAGGPRGYRLRRILLTNFWLYGQQEFEIPHGRVFLAGENASGKSTVLTAALPLALDGDLRPNRIDTFGGRERHIEYYVLGSNDSATPFSHERRTTYIALEFEWCDSDRPPIAQELRQRWENGDRERTRFLTIGVSLAGNINASDHIRPLRFLITDGSRLGYDLHTVYETGNKREKRAYDHSRFKQVLEGHGIVCESQAEYERQVARYLFGFSDVKDFQKLINLLLVLRRPNLSTELNFSRVHDYLKQSLRKVSSETTSRVIGTIERIDAIQSEIERIQEAYDATECLHRARQGLALARAQLAACDYMGAQLTENSVQNRVNRLRKDLSAVDTERKRAETRSQSIQTELYQISGQIKALEASEGLQVANRLDVTRQRVQEAEAQMHLQEQSLEAVHRAIEENSRSLERQRLRFEKTKAEGITRLRELRSIAAEESYWETAAFQLEEGLDQVNLLSPEASSAPQVPLGVTQLIGVEADERVVWLRHLAELHEQREKLEARVQYARSHETTRFQELDDVRRRFQSIQDRGYEAQQRLDKILEPFIETHGFTLPTMGSASIEEGRVQAGDTQDDESLGRSAVEQFASIVNDYRQVIDALENELSDSVDHIQGELNKLQLLVGSKSHELAEAKARYEQKLAEPEFTPLRPTRRTLARAKLAEHGIVALPLYALLDFAPGIDSQGNDAGRIEYALEDAGLLDALVVAPAQIAVADALLASEGLSDCRLDLDALASVKVIESVSPLGLRFDTTANETLKESDTNWEALTITILAALGQHFDTYSDENTFARWILNEDGTWTHGLLTGRTGGGPARCIGQTTRLRVRQRELDELDAQRAQLEAELQELHTQLAYYETQLIQIQEQQAKLRKVLSKSGIEEIYTELLSAQRALDEATKKYQKARQQTQEARQSCNTLIAHLERASKGIVLLASDARRVQSALMGMIKLKNSAQSLQVQLGNLSHTWEEYQKAREAREQARINEANVARVYDNMRQQTTQAQAELAELQRIAEFANVEALGERLHTLREQSEALSAQLESAKMEYTRADERANNTASLLEEAEEHLQQVQTERTEKQAHFVDLLAIYPVEELVAAQELTGNSEYVRAAQHVLAINLALESIRQAPLRESDIPALKERVEEQYRDAYNVLARTFNREQPLLLEYGPDLDDQGHVRFLNEHRSTPVELLEILSERIEMQKTLLGQEERQLFEDFLLQEMAEAIRTHILEAEEWVQQINNVLSNLPMIGEHYSLQWKPLPEFDPTKLGSHLAQHYRLLRKPAQTLTAEETETLMGAFRREIEAVRIQQQEHSDMNFMDALEQVFDYREWFHFDVWVTPIGGQRQRLTDRVAGTRSGAEQLFALYIPLFAALGAIYRSATPGAPRLLALDEAFDKVSVANTQRIIEFLVSQDFQWIMTGPHISGMGAKIPACARYLMIHEKGSPVATASASFWSDQQPTTKDDYAKGNAS